MSNVRLDAKTRTRLRGQLTVELGIGVGDTERNAKVLALIDVAEACAAWVLAEGDDVPAKVWQAKRDAALDALDKAGWL